MIDPRLERLADEVRDAMHCEPPIDPRKIAREEGILLGAGDFGDTFSGRIEYHSRELKFLLFYPEVGNPRRIRFSIAHELGHYYIEEHRRMLLGGNAHNSNAGFICDERMEREADLFAAALLIPRAVIERKAHSTGFLTLNGILRMAEECEASATCAAIRYAQYAEEACAVVLSQSGRVLFGITSDEMGTIGFKIIKKGTVVPEDSPTARCMAQPKVGTIVEGQWKGEGWFANRYREIDLWEEATPLGYSGLFLTLLAKESGESEEEEDEQ
ncbi:MAG: ImmA/IrrE family metallo-endopeptidase [Verrucomicrobia bacterium]|nr:ImmA/IrrE family metallo-endopeptidase [Verrucomicrobiota bacterium]